MGESYLMNFEPQITYMTLAPDQTISFKTNESFADIFNLDKPKKHVPNITKVVFNNPATIVFWEDGSKTVVKCQEGDTYSEEIGLVFAIAKKALGNTGRFNETLKKWCK